MQNGVRGGWWWRLIPQRAGWRASREPPPAEGKEQRGEDEGGAEHGRHADQLVTAQVREPLDLRIRARGASATRCIAHLHAAHAPLTPVREEATPTCGDVLSVEHFAACFWNAPHTTLCSVLESVCMFDPDCFITFYVKIQDQDQNLEVSHLLSC